MFMCNAEAVHEKADEQQQEQNVPDDSTAELGPKPGAGKNPITEDDLKSPNSLDTPVSPLKFQLIDLCLWISKLENLDFVWKFSERHECERASTVAPWY